MGRRGTPNIIHLARLPTTITISDIPNEYTHCHNYVCYSSKPKSNATEQLRYCRPTVRECLYSSRPRWLSGFASISYVPGADPGFKKRGGSNIFLCSHVACLKQRVYNYYCKLCVLSRGGWVLHACQSSVIHTEPSSFWRLKYLSFEGHSDKKNGVYF